MIRTDGKPTISTAPRRVTLGVKRVVRTVPYDAFHASLREPKRGTISR